MQTINLATPGRILAACQGSLVKACKKTGGIGLKEGEEPESIEKPLEQSQSLVRFEDMLAEDMERERKERQKKLEGEGDEWVEGETALPKGSSIPSFYASSTLSFTALDLWREKRLKRMAFGFVILIIAGVGGKYFLGTLG